MINRNRIRRILAPTTGLRKAALIVLLGLLCFLLGTALSFKLAIQPLLEGLKRSADQMLQIVVPVEMLDQATHILGGALLFLGIYFLYLYSPQIPVSEKIWVMTRRLEYRLESGRAFRARHDQTKVDTLNTRIRFIAYIQPIAAYAQGKSLMA